MLIVDGLIGHFRLLICSFSNFKSYGKTSWLALRNDLQLSSKYYDPYRILTSNGKVSYRLDLPSDSNVYHVSYLKKKVGNHVVVETYLPSVGVDGQIIVQLVSILQRYMTKKNNVVVVKVLVQWSNLHPEDATWEDYLFLKAKFVGFDSHP